MKLYNLSRILLSPLFVFHHFKIPLLLSVRFIQHIVCTLLWSRTIALPLAIFSINTNQIFWHSLTMPPTAWTPQTSVLQYQNYKLTQRGLLCIVHVSIQCRPQRLGKENDCTSNFIHYLLANLLFIYISCSKIKIPQKWY